MPNADGTPTNEELVVARNRMGGLAGPQAELARDVEKIIAIGRATYGDDQFDSDSTVVAERLGPRVPEFMAIAAQFDNPHKLVKHFADRPEELEALAKLPTARITTEIARIEGRSAPYGHAVTRAAPLWKSSGNGLVSNADWNRGAADNMSDEDFDRNLRARQRARAERRGHWR